ncbi:VOC family protein [Asanoa sp. WMMD1127]|uniref:VOC family protein n=1 Tax=Asanoa sp. WMMD1127 TaxID=3016107 RepID=UPI0024175F04|nr:VOC family protein [Asanoa sp. WMMD1127]MDG4822999.1 VOC family protein [Asanoa sp. WMMD1127]
MNPTLSHCFIIVEDHDEALAFYRDVLGLEVRNDVDMTDWGMPWRWVTIGAPGQPGIEIGLDPVASKAPADQEPLRTLMTKGALSALIFDVADCDAAFEKIRASGAEVLQEPIDQPYGVRDCAFRDPSGNMVRFSQRR